MILGFRLTVAITGWAAVRDAGLAARPDLERRRFRTPPYEGLVGPAVLSAGPGHAGAGFRLVSAWTEPAALMRHEGTKRHCYDVHGLGLLTDAEVLLASVRGGLHGEHAPHDAFRLSVTGAGAGAGFEPVGLALLGPHGFDPVGF